MFWSLRTLLVALLSCWLSDIVNAGWKADTSCNLHINDIRTAINSAFDNSRAVVAQQTNPYFLKSAGYLMPLSTIPNAVGRYVYIIQYYSEDVNSYNMGFMGGDDVVVYCDLSRYESKTVKTIGGRAQLVHYDKVLNLDWPHGDFGDFAWAGCSGLGFPQFIYALSIANAEQNPNKPDQIQLCPWYLNWIMTQKFKDSTSVKPAWLQNVLPETEEVLFSRSKTKMDVRTGALLDIKLSHELTRLTRAGQSIDVYGGNSLYADGWNYCIENAAQGYKVAESLAMLGAAAVMIQEDDVMPDRAGNIVPLSLDAKKAKRAEFVREGG